MKTLQFLILFLFAGLVAAQQTVRIDFRPGSPGDYDLMLKENLERNGNRAFINYGESTQAADFILKYELKSLKKFGAIRHQLRLDLLDAGGNALKTATTKVNANNRPNLAICRGLEELFGYGLNCPDCRQFPKTGSFNIDFTVNKIDSAAYLIVARGAAARKHAGVKKALFRKANQYLDGFSYYCLEGTYQYSVNWNTYEAPAVVGWVYGLDTPGERQELKEIPVEVNIEFSLVGNDGGGK